MTCPVQIATPVGAKDTLACATVGIHFDHVLGAQDTVFRRAQELLMSDDREKGAITHIAASLQMSRNGFFRAFRDSVGATPYQWLLTQRIAHARRLLTGTDLPLVEIALTCGFSDQSHFTRVFRRAEGMSPGRWRRRCQ